MVARRTTTCPTIKEAAMLIAPLILLLVAIRRRK